MQRAGVMKEYGISVDHDDLVHLFLILPEDGPFFGEKHYIDASDTPSRLP